MSTQEKICECGFVVTQNPECIFCTSYPVNPLAPKSELKPEAHIRVVVYDGVNPPIAMPILGPSKKGE